MGQGTSLAFVPATLYEIPNGGVVQFDVTIASCGTVIYRPILYASFSLFIYIYTHIYIFFNIPSYKFAQTTHTHNAAN